MRMKLLMSTIIRKKFKIFTSIIISNAINMVHNFFRSKVTPKMFFHYKPVFQNIFTFTAKRMFGLININISIRSFNSSTYPHVMFCARTLRKFLAFIRSYLSLLKTSSRIKMYSLKIFIPRRMSYFRFIITFLRARFSSTSFYCRKFNPKFFFANLTYSFNRHFIFLLKKAAFKSPIKERLSSQTLLTAHFGQIKFVLLLAIISITFLLGFVKYSFTEDWVRNPDTGERDVVFDKADEINIDDAGSYYTGTEVETALQEIPATFLPANYLKLDGSNANTTIDIGSEDLITTGTGTFDKLIATTLTDPAFITEGQYMAFYGREDADFKPEFFAPLNRNVALTIYANSGEDFGGGFVPWLTFATSIANNVTYLQSITPMDFYTGDTNDYIRYQTLNNIPELLTIGSCDLKINAGGSNDLLLNDGGGNVGIGTTDPTEAFHVVGDIKQEDATPHFLMEDSDTGIGYLWHNNAGAPWNNYSLWRTLNGAVSPNKPLMYWDNSNNLRIPGGDFTIDSSGNVGIGTTSPDGTLHVHTHSAGSATANTVANDLVIENNTAGGLTILTPDVSKGTFAFGTPSDVLGARFEWNYNNNQFSVGSSSPAAKFVLRAGNEQERVTILANGNVGINTSTPGERLVISGDGNKLAFGAAEDYNIEWDGDDGVHTITAGDFAFMGGNVGIGDASPSARMHIKSPSTSIDVFTVERSGGSTKILDFAETSGGDGLMDIKTDGNVVNIRFNAGGDSFILNNVGIGTTSPDTTLQVVGDFKVGDDNTNYVEIETDGDVNFVGGAGLPFGNLNLDEGSLTVSIGAQSTYTEVNDVASPSLTVGNLHNITFSDHYLDVGAYQGFYLVTWSMSVQTTNASDELSGTIMVDGTADLSATNHATMPAANKEVSLSGNTIVDLTTNKQVSLAVSNHTAIRDIIISHVNLSIVQLGGT